MHDGVSGVWGGGGGGGGGEWVGGRGERMRGGGSGMFGLSRRQVDNRRQIDGCRELDKVGVCPPRSAQAACIVCTYGGQCSGVPPNRDRQGVGRGGGGGGGGGGCEKLYDLSYAECTLSMVASSVARRQDELSLLVRVASILKTLL